MIMVNKAEKIKRWSRFHSLSDEELHYHVMSDFESKTYCRPRIGSLLLKDMFLNLFNSYHI